VDLAARPRNVRDEVREVVEDIPDKAVRGLAEPPHGEGDEHHTEHLHLPGHHTPHREHEVGEKICDEVGEDHNGIEHSCDTSMRMLLYILCMLFCPSYL